jgi:hypothetical protein
MQTYVKKLGILFVTIPHPCTQRTHTRPRTTTLKETQCERRNMKSAREKCGCTFSNTTICNKDM